MEDDPILLLLPRHLSPVGPEKHYPSPVPTALPSVPPPPRSSPAGTHDTHDTPFNKGVARFAELSATVREAQRLRTQSVALFEALYSRASA